MQRSRDRKISRPISHKLRILKRCNRCWDTFKYAFQLRQHLRVHLMKSFTVCIHDAQTPSPNTSTSTTTILTGTPYVNNRYVSGARQVQYKQHSLMTNSDLFTGSDGVKQPRLVGNTCRIRALVPSSSSSTVTRNRVLDNDRRGVPAFPTIYADFPEGVQCSNDVSVCFEGTLQRKIKNEPNCYEPDREIGDNFYFYQSGLSVTDVTEKTRTLSKDEARTEQVSYQDDARDFDKQGYSVDLEPDFTVVCKISKSYLESVPCLDTYEMTLDTYNGSVEENLHSIVDDDNTKSVAQSEDGTYLQNDNSNEDKHVMAQMSDVDGEMLYTKDDGTYSKDDNNNEDQCMMDQMSDVDGEMLCTNDNGTYSKDDNNNNEDEYIIDQMSDVDREMLCTKDHGTYSKDDNNIVAVDLSAPSLQQHSMTSGDLHTDAGDLHTDSGDLHTDAGDLHTDAGDLHTDAGDLHTDAGDLHTDAGDLHTDACDSNDQIIINHGHNDVYLEDIVSVDRLMPLAEYVQLASSLHGETCAPLSSQSGPKCFLCHLCGALYSKNAGLSIHLVAHQRKDSSEKKKTKYKTFAAETEHSDVKCSTTKKATMAGCSEKGFLKAKPVCNRILKTTRAIKDTVKTKSVSNILKVTHSTNGVLKAKSVSKRELKVNNSTNGELKTKSVSKNTLKANTSTNGELKTKPVSKNTLKANTSTNGELKTKSVSKNTLKANNSTNEVMTTKPISKRVLKVSNSTKGALKAKLKATNSAKGVLKAKTVTKKVIEVKAKTVSKKVLKAKAIPKKGLKAKLTDVNYSTKQRLLKTKNSDARYPTNEALKAKQIMQNNDPAKMGMLNETVFVSEALCSDNELPATSETKCPKIKTKHSLCNNSSSSKSMFHNNVKRKCLTEKNILKAVNSETEYPFTEELPIVNVCKRKYTSMTRSSKKVMKQKHSKSKGKSSKDVFMSEQSLDQYPATKGVLTNYMLWKNTKRTHNRMRHCGTRDEIHTVHKRIKNSMGCQDSFVRISKSTSKTWNKNVLEYATHKKPGRKLPVKACEYCHRIITVKYIRRHLEAHCHGSPKPSVTMAKCHFCSKSVLFRNLEKHIAAIHNVSCKTNSKPLSRPQYKKNHFVDNKDLKLTSREPSDSSFEGCGRHCLICKTEKLSVYNIRSHIVGHITDDNFSRMQLCRGTRYRCPVCLKRFTLDTHIESHVLSHWKIQLFVCPVCKQQFTRYDYLQIHIHEHKTNTRQTHDSDN